jgi:NAD(P)H-quinone oxidoreductase subunit 5
MSAIALLPYLAPAALAAVALLSVFESGKKPQRVLWASRAATLGALALAALSALLVAAQGTITSPTLGIDGIGFSLRLDALSVTMFGLVAFVGVIVVQFSRNYLEGDDRHGAFLGGLCLTIGSVLFLVLAGNLFQLGVAWIATSLALHRLLVFYPERPGALVGARKKFIVARLGDACLAVALVLVARTLGAADLGGVLEAARAVEAAAIPSELMAAGVLVAVAAALKSAQFPTHGWVLEVMETPTPVSALLHAGLINAGTFLVVRLGDVMLLSPFALYMLVVIGGFTALYASLVMVTQTSVKVSLGYSSAAHMGFMLMLCGFGAYYVAILHLVAHSFYKAHAFFSSGSIVDYARGVGSPEPDPAPRPLRLLTAFGLSLGVFVGVGAGLGVTVQGNPVAMTLGAIFVLAITHLLFRGLGDRPSGHVFGRTALAAGGVALAFFVLERGAAMILSSAFRQPEVYDAATYALMVAVVVAFASVSLFQVMIPAKMGDPRWRAAYVHLRNGLYANVWFDRWVGALRVRGARQA